MTTDQNLMDWGNDEKPCAFNYSFDLWQMLCCLYVSSLQFVKSVAKDIVARITYDKEHKSCSLTRVNQFQCHHHVWNRLKISRSSGNIIESIQASLDHTNCIRRWTTLEVQQKRIFRCHRQQRFMKKPWSDSNVKSTRDFVHGSWILRRKRQLRNSVWSCWLTDWSCWQFVHSIAS